MSSRWAVSSLAGLALAVIVGPLAHAAEPLLEKTDIFEAGKGGYTIYRIPGIVATNKGTLLAYCEARNPGKTDWDTIDIMLKRSTDGGKTWSEMKKIADVPGEHVKNPVAVAQKLGSPDMVTYNNPVAFADRKTGAVHFLFCLEYMRCFYMRSDDDGATFSKPVEITAAFEGFRKEYDWKVLATGPAHGIQLKDGRLVVPVWLSTGTGGGAHRPSCVATIYSDDSGKTWHAGEIAARDSETLRNPNETVLIQLTDGRVLLNMRSESNEHRRSITLSPDGATKWTQPKFDEQLKEPICMASICRFSEKSGQDRDRIVFVNPDNLERADGKAKPGQGRDRKNVSVKLSYDEGKTWEVSKALEPGGSGYSDVTVDGHGNIYVLYERAGKRNPFSPEALTVAKFNLEWLTDGKDKFASAP
jgi:sialidase-1